MVQSANICVRTCEIGIVIVNTAETYSAETNLADADANKRWSPYKHIKKHDTCKLIIFWALMMGERGLTFLAI